MLSRSSWPSSKFIMMLSISLIGAINLIFEAYLSGVRVLITPDSFKDAASSAEIASAVCDGVKWVDPGIICDLLPIADGGEGSLESLYTCIGGEWVTCSTRDPWDNAIEARFLMNGKTAYIELAEASGLQRLDILQRNPGLTSTHGTGVIIREALERDIEEVVLFIGGSATNDAGLGIAHALGIQFLDSEGRPFLPTGFTLKDVKTIVRPQRLPYRNIDFKILCDVRNPFTGPRGAVFTFAAQKGAQGDELNLLEQGMKHIGDLLSTFKGERIFSLAGAGAAGGVGGGLYALLDAKLVEGFSWLAEKAGLSQRVGSADLVITGEGKLDNQTGHGKVISGVIKLAREMKVPVVAVCGAVHLSREEISGMGLLAALAIQPGPMSLEEAREKTIVHIKECTSQIMRLFLSKVAHET